MRSGTCAVASSRDAASVASMLLALVAWMNQPNNPTTHEVKSDSPSCGFRVCKRADEQRICRLRRGESCFQETGRGSTVGRGGRREGGEGTGRWRTFHSVWPYLRSVSTLSGPNTSTRAEASVRHCAASSSHPAAPRALRFQLTASRETKINVECMAWNLGC